VIDYQKTFDAALSALKLGGVDALSKVLYPLKMDESYQFRELAMKSVIFEELREKTIGIHDRKRTGVVLNLIRRHFKEEHGFSVESCLQISRQRARSEWIDLIFPPHDGEYCRGNVFIATCGLSVCLKCHGRDVT